MPGFSPRYKFDPQNFTNNTNSLARPHDGAHEADVELFSIRGEERVAPLAWVGHRQPDEALSLQRPEADTGVDEAERSDEELQEAPAVHVDLVVGDDEDDAPPPEVYEVLVDDDLLRRRLNSSERLRVNYLRKLNIRKIQQNLRKIHRRRVLEAQRRDQARTVELEIARVDDPAARRQPDLGHELDLGDEREALPRVERHLAQNLPAPHAQLHLERDFQLDDRACL